MIDSRLEHDFTAFMAFQMEIRPVVDVEQPRSVDLASRVSPNY